MTLASGQLRTEPNVSPFYLGVGGNKTLAGGGRGRGVLTPLLHYTPPTVTLHHLPSYLLPRMQSETL